MGENAGWIFYVALRLKRFQESLPQKKIKEGYLRTLRG
jgi:hypothetical protein